LAGHSLLIVVTGVQFAVAAKAAGIQGIIYFWYAGDILWRLHGWHNTMVGDPGLRRGRRGSERVDFGESLDFNIHADGEVDRSQLTIAARYRPRGLLGILYWYSVVPLHNIVWDTQRYKKSCGEISIEQGCFGVF
jgi:hypothetical protein